MLIEMAHAAADVAEVVGEAPVAPDANDALKANLALILFLVVAFYFLMIRPQQKRFRQHSDMLRGLKKGEKVITQGGIIGKIDKITEEDEVILDLGNSVKITVARSAISTTYTAKPGNDNAEKGKKESKDKKAKAAKK